MTHISGDRPQIKSRPTQQIASLTAPEAYILLHGTEAGTSLALKVAMTELVARDSLRLKQTGGTRIFAVRDRGASPPTTLRAVWEFLAEQPKAFYHRSADSWGGDFSGDGGGDNGGGDGGTDGGE